MVRHAESRFNIASHNYRVQHNLSYIWEELCKHQGFVLGVKYNPDLIDADITEKGVNQCIKARDHVKDVKPDIILVSPLLRTLRTCSIVF
jgi:broad specificity phosphatase PhoE